jgi:hypothetical protein
MGSSLPPGRSLYLPSRQGSHRLSPSSRRVVGEMSQTKAWRGYFEIRKVKGYAEVCIASTCHHHSRMLVLVPMRHR